MLGDLERKRLDVHLRRHLLEDAAFPGALCLADERDDDGGLDRLVEPDLLEVDVRDRAANLVALEVLEDRRVLGAPVDRDVEHDVRPGRPRQRGAEVTLPDRNRDRRRTAVQDARNQPLPSQAARFGGTQLGPLRNG